MKLSADPEHALLLGIHERAILERDGIEGQTLALDAPHVGERRAVLVRSCLRDDRSFEAEIQNPVHQESIAVAERHDGDRGAGLKRIVADGQTLIDIADLGVEQTMPGVLALRSVVVMP